ncbi:isovaleryl-CoA dehydrogenase [Marinibaculum pumilum]|uniref:Isovaleryl-CoA dehydrogenase n=1 Tax=Marinibaculum pumilum TaxID=1766165 RepID=A0ABV7KZN0_9PROT
MSEARDSQPSLATPYATHEVTNQPPPLEDINLFSSDTALREGVAREGAGWAVDDLTAFGAKVGSAEMIEAGHLANRHTPELKAFDRFGHRLDRVDFHPAYHKVMAASIKQGLHASPWSEPRPGAQVKRAAGMILMSQVEVGHLCPVSMTYASVPVLRRQPDLGGAWLPKILSRDYDPRFLPAPQKKALQIGMGMTEKQGGSDVRTNATQAVPLDGGGPGTAYAITGHKWFMSAPMCDAFLILAQAPAGISCFLLPRFLPDGSLNAIRIQRLKEKVGNRSNASSEVEFANATGWLVGEEGRGVSTIIEMASYSRQESALASTGLMRQAVVQAVHHARHRRAFQRHLIDQPLMTNVLADMALEVEAATALMLRLARAVDAQEDDPLEQALRRIVTPAAKYWICKRAPILAAEAMEVLGGNGYVEDGILGRIYREMPVNSIWEGSGNVMCLDVLRAMQRNPESLEALLAMLRDAAGADRRLDGAIARIEAYLAAPAEIEAQGRRFVELLAVTLQAALLVNHAPAAVADAFCASRLADDWGHAYGTLPGGTDQRAIAERAFAA